MLMNNRRKSYEKFVFYDAKQYDIESFNKQLKDYPEITVDYIETDINERTASLADGYDAICAFVSSDLGKNTIKILGKGVSLILMRCAGYNNVDLATADDLGLQCFVFRDIRLKQ